MKKRLLSLALAALFSLGSANLALAETITMDGVVTAAETVTIKAPIGGEVQDVTVEAGDAVSAGMTLVTLKTNKVYATEPGVVTGIFGTAGDGVTAVAERYGAVVLVEPANQYTITASTKNAYDNAANKFVHAGEQVYLAGHSDSTHKGFGVITAVSGSDFTVQVLENSFSLDESVNVYRSPECNSASRIGRGSTVRQNPIAYTGSGSIVSFSVQNGDLVQRGDVLFETLDGIFDGSLMIGSDIFCDGNGIVKSVSAAKGNTVAKNDTLMVIYPTEAIRLEATATESDLSSLFVGQKVDIQFSSYRDSDIVYQGVIEKISFVAQDAVASASGSEASYTVYIRFTPDNAIRYGMTAEVTALDEAVEITPITNGTVQQPENEANSSEIESDLNQDGNQE